MAICKKKVTYLPCSPEIALLHISSKESHISEETCRKMVIAAFFIMALN